MKVLLCISGASGVVYGERSMRTLSKMENIDVDLVISEAARGLLELELDVEVDDIISLTRNNYDPNELNAPPASGSSLYDAVAIVPCSVSTLSKIAAGIGDNLITRAAAVALKENRKLILVLRETPLSRISLENMVTVCSAGGTILPACPAFYGSPKSMDDLIDFIVGKLLDCMGIENDTYTRWTG
ncbi:MAG: UbiX family flavin prenyltransferase [Thermoplasmata archaeon]